jgi:hypothetical protein
MQFEAATDGALAKHFDLPWDKAQRSSPANFDSKRGEYVVEDDNQTRDVK